MIWSSLSLRDICGDTFSLIIAFEDGVFLGFASNCMIWIFLFEKNFANQIFWNTANLSENFENYFEIFFQDFNSTSLLFFVTEARSLPFGLLSL